jgi:hypothetical protein
MQNSGTTGRFRRLVSKLKGRDIPSPITSPTSSQESQGSQAVTNDYNDRQRAMDRYQKAGEQLKEAIKLHKGPWSSLDFEELGKEPERIDDSQFKNKINSVLASREKLIDDRNGWSKFTYAVECVFTSFSPFAKNFINATMGAQSVILFSLIWMYPNSCADTLAKSIWCSLQQSLPLNNGSPLSIEMLNVDCG